MSLESTPSSSQERNVKVIDEYYQLAYDFLRTMRITTNARFEAAKRLKRINSICFLSTTLASLGLILIPLLDIAGHNKFFTSNTLTVFQIFLAVCVLVYSAAISTANFSVRSKEFLECGDKIKAIVNDFRLHLIDVKDLDQPPSLKSYTEMYSKVLIGTENHEDVDYLRSLSLYNEKEKRKKKKEPSQDPKDIKWYSIWIFNPIKIVFFNPIQYLYKNRRDLQIILNSNIKIYLPFIFLMMLELVFIGDMLGYWGFLNNFHK